MATIYLTCNNGWNRVVTVEQSALSLAFQKVTLQAEGGTTKDVGPGISWTSGWAHYG
ncbi:hypothetical protein [Thermoactinospora rubra]|uniref:hypothetical protein n=1 Tax=Thermoactinospora rubra TaxID=1088767 RepID=UPI001301D0AD|nr:hypothetical protein [Thermoactinospora rubra]